MTFRKVNKLLLCLKGRALWGACWDIVGMTAEYGMTMRIRYYVMEYLQRC